MFILKADRNVSEGAVAISAAIRSGLKLSPTLDKPVIGWYELPKQLFMLGTLKFSVTTPTLKAEEKVEIKEEDFVELFRKTFKDHLVGTGQEFYWQLNVKLI